MQSPQRYDLFLSHASEDKDDFARPLFEALRARGVTVWFDEAVLQLGDSLRRKVDEGLGLCRFGLVILSPHFFEKQWPQRELDGLVARETASGQEAILPVWHGVERDDVLRYSAPLADRLAAKSSEGTAAIVEKILRVLRKSRASLEQASSGSSEDTLRDSGAYRAAGASARTCHRLGSLLDSTSRIRSAMGSFKRSAIEMSPAIDASPWVQGHTRKGTRTAGARIFVPKGQQDLAGGFSRRNSDRPRASPEWGGRGDSRRCRAAFSVVPSGLARTPHRSPAAYAAGYILLSLWDLVDR